MTKLVEEDVTREDMAWTKLIESPSAAVIIKVEDTPKESPTSSDPPISERKSSLFGTFHRHLRMSLKAVTDSPGPMTRYAK